MKVPVTPSGRSKSDGGEAHSRKRFVYKAVEWHTSPSWYCDCKLLSWPLKLSLWNSSVMTDRDFPLVSGRNRPMYSADNRQTAPKGTKQNWLKPLCKGKTARCSLTLCSECCFHNSCMKSVERFFKIKFLFHFCHRCHGQSYYFMCLQTSDNVTKFIWASVTNHNHQQLIYYVLIYFKTKSSRGRIHVHLSQFQYDILHTNAYHALLFED